MDQSIICSNCEQRELLHNGSIQNCGHFLCQNCKDKGCNLDSCVQKVMNTKEQAKQIISKQTNKYFCQKHDKDIDYECPKCCLYFCGQCVENKICPHVRKYFNREAYEKEFESAHKSFGYLISSLQKQMQQFVLKDNNQKVDPNLMNIKFMEFKKEIASFPQMIEDLFPHALHRTIFSQSNILAEYTHFTFLKRIMLKLKLNFKHQIYSMKQEPLLTEGIFNLASANAQFGVLILLKGNFQAFGIYVDSPWPFHEGKKYQYRESGGLIFNFSDEVEREIDSIGVGAGSGYQSKLRIISDQSEVIITENDVHSIKSFIRTQSLDDVEVYTQK